MLNSVALQGRLTRDPEFRTTPSGVAVVGFTLACDRDFSNDQGQRETDFITCVAWRGTAEFISKYFTKGQLMAVQGRLQVRSYEAQDGQKRTVTEIVVSGAYFCGSKQEGGGQQRRDSIYPQRDQPPAPPTQQQTTMNMYPDDDDELPF